MKHIFLSITAVAMMAAACSTGDTFVSPVDSKIAYSGRIDMTDSTALAFTYPGVAAEIICDAREVKMATTPGAGSFMVEVDNDEPFKITVSDADSVVTLAQNLSKGEHRIKVVYVMEGYEAHPAFKGFYLSDGGSLTRRPETKPLKIEFIGNSITCGYGLDTDNPEDRFCYETENHYHTYAARTARALNADYNVVARSGIGIYRNYGGPREGNSDMTMPLVYDRTLFDKAEPKWDFSRFTPDVVCVNLGTNDTSLDNYDTGLLTDGYREFTARLRRVYPGARIVLLTGSMLNGRALEDVKSALDIVASEARENGDTLVNRFDMTPADGSLGYGADYHPSQRRAQVMASELTRYLQGLGY